MSSATSPTVCFMKRSAFFFAESPEEAILEGQLLPLSTKPPVPAIWRFTFPPQVGHFERGGALIFWVVSNSPHFPHLYSYVGTPSLRWQNSDVIIS